VQPRRGMKPLLVVALLALPLAVATPAAAGGYVAFGLGSDAVLTGDLGERFDSEATGSGRLGFGVRYGPLALEASGFGATAATPLADDAPRGAFSPLSLGVDVKYHLAFLPVVEVYGRAGLNRTWLMNDDSGSAGYSGTGHALGGGLQLPLRALPVVQAAVWLDYTRHTTRLESSAGDAVGGNAHLLMLGLSVGTRL
jgi:hypothetical protein